jgi:2-polyprenyl-3-methyl-5-hydroxy-6-metoxy-1,4-benzoquinol methylase
MGNEFMATSKPLLNIEAGFKIANRLVHRYPSPETALDIFKGIWISKFPGELSAYEGGAAPLFEDMRIPAAVPYLGSFAGTNVLDLGPLEGGQAYVAEKMGASRVVAVETNALLYLKCLVSKEVLGMKKVQFLCGDVVEYLKKTEEIFDICLCCGILYHMVDPVELIDLISQRIGKVLLWTHYYDDVNLERNKISHTGSLQKTFKSKTYTYHKQEYREGFTTDVYCGGAETYSSWMSKSDILDAFNAFGFETVNVLGDGDSISGPWILLTAVK